MKRLVNQAAKAIALALSLSLALAATALAQQPGVSHGAALSSQPGKANLVRTVDVSAEVVGIDTATRTVTLKGPSGDSVDVVAGDEVKNFDRIKLGDFVVARYVEALTLELRKTKSGTGEVVTREEIRKAKPGEQPAVAGTRQVATIADVTAVDPVKSTITIKGPKGNVVTLDVQNPAQFEVVKVGDQIEVTYTEALALRLEPAPAKK